jgi:hypothetical protein
LNSAWPLLLCACHWKFNGSMLSNELYQLFLRITNANITLNPHIFQVGSSTLNMPYIKHHRNDSTVVSQLHQTLQTCSWIANSIFLPFHVRYNHYICSFVLEYVLIIQQPIPKIPSWQELPENQWLANLSNFII